jgi:hypothetical protein
MPRKSISGFAEAGAAMAQQLDDNDLLNLFTAVGRVVSKRHAGYANRRVLSVGRIAFDRTPLDVDQIRGPANEETADVNRRVSLRPPPHIKAQEPAPQAGTRNGRNLERFKYRGRHPGPPPPGHACCCC